MKKESCSRTWAFFIWHSLMLAVMILIFRFSAQNGDASMEISNGALAWILNAFAWLFPKAFAEWLTIWIRKVAHYLIYLALGFTATGAFSSSPRQNVAGKGICYTCACGLLTAAAYACTDEFHQLFVPERSGQLTDVLLDSTGAFCGVLLFAAGYEVWKWMRKKR